MSVCERTAVLLNIAAATNRKQSELICLYERVRLDKEAAMRGAKGCEVGGRGGRRGRERDPRQSGADGARIHRIGAQPERSESRVRAEIFFSSHSHD